MQFRTHSCHPYRTLRSVGHNIHKQPEILHTHIYTHTHTYIHTYIYTYKHTPTCIHTYIHTYIHTNINTYIHAFILNPGLQYARWLQGSQNAPHT